MGRKQRVRKVRFPSESISRQDYQTGTNTSSVHLSLVPRFSVAVGVFSIKGISYYTTLAHTHRLDRSYAYAHRHERMQESVPVISTSDMHHD